jgi:cysteine desulfurase
LIGGSQESGKRGGTENTAYIVGIGKAAELAAAHFAEEDRNVKPLRDWLEQALLNRVPGTQLNGHPAKRLPNTSSLAIDGVDSEGMLMLLDKEGVCCSAGSACTSGSLEPSHVLKAMGFANERARGSLRFSLSRFTTSAEIDQALEIISRAVEKLRSMNQSVVVAA